MTYHWLLLLVPCTLVAATDAECMSMVQRQASPLPRRRARPWDVYNYVTAEYHKAGSFLQLEIHYKMFHILGAKEMESLGKIEYPCYQGACWNTEAPVLELIDQFSASWRDAHPPSKPRKVTGSVRDPLDMVASAYCYHHEGKELGNRLIPVPELMLLGPEAGTPVAAEHLLPIVEMMASIFAEPDNNTLRLSFERFTESSAGFDHEVQRWLNHNFGSGDDLISAQERSQILEEVKAFDEHRNASATLSPYNGYNHSTSPECQKKAYAAVPKMDSSLLRRYQELQERLGYPVYRS